MIEIIDREHSLTRGVTATVVYPPDCVLRGFRQFPYCCVVRKTPYGVYVEYRTREFTSVPPRARGYERMFGIDECRLHCVVTIDEVIDMCASCAYLKTKGV